MCRQKQKVIESQTAKIKKLFSLTDKDESDTIDKKELQNILSENEVKLWLAAMDFNASKDPDLIFDWIDADGDGVISLDELMKGITSLRGAARQMELNVLMRNHDNFVLDHNDLHRKVSGLIFSVEQ